MNVSNDHSTRKQDKLTERVSDMELNRKQKEHLELFDDYADQFREIIKEIYAEQETNISTAEANERISNQQIAFQQWIDNFGEYVATPLGQAIDEYEDMMVGRKIVINDLVVETKQDDE